MQDMPVKLCPLLYHSERDKMYICFDVLHFNKIFLKYGLDKQKIESLINLLSSTDSSYNELLLLSEGLITSNDTLLSSSYYKEQYKLRQPSHINSHVFAILDDDGIYPFGYTDDSLYNTRTKDQFISLEQMIDNLIKPSSNYIIFIAYIKDGKKK